jgi:hypothetical protein
MKKATLTILFSVAFSYLYCANFKDMTNIQEEIQLEHDPLTGELIPELWRPVVGYEGLYNVSNYGRVKSLPRFKNNNGGKCFVSEIILKAKRHHKGYLENSLCKEGICKKHKSHRILAIAWIPNPENKPQVNHIFGIKDRNRAWELEWCTNLENNHHSWNSLNRKGPDGSHCKKPVYQVSMDGFFIQEFNSAIEASRATGICHIPTVARGERNHAGGYKWYY